MADLDLVDRVQMLDQCFKNCVPSDDDYYYFISLKSSYNPISGVHFYRV